MKSKIVLLILCLIAGGSAVQAAPSVVVLKGGQDGKCSPDMPMVAPQVLVTIQIEATADKAFVLESSVLKLNMKAAAGKKATQTVTFPNIGDYAFTCGAEALPQSQRTQGMFMSMKM